MRDGRIGNGGGAGAAAWALALIAGCTAPPARPAVHSRNQAFEPQPCVPTYGPDNPDLLPECVPEHSADPAPTCVPLKQRGREIARDDEAHLRAYEVCAPESRYAHQPRLRVDPGRVIVERSGERLAREDELETIAWLFSDNKPSRAPDLPNGKPAPREGLELSARPEAAICAVAEQEGQSCLRMHLLGPRPELARLLAGIAKWLPSDGTCIAMEVDYGWREGCPEVNLPRPQKQAAR